MPQAGKPPALPVPVQGYQQSPLNQWERGIGGGHPMRIKLSGLPLCEAGDWGLQTPKNILFVLFFCGYAAKKENKRGLGAAPSGKYALA